VPAQPQQLLLARQGNRPALQELIREYQGPIARFVVFRIGEDGGQYEDLCQAIFVKVVRNLPRLKSTEAFEAWLFRIATNACNDHLRRRRLRRRFFVALERRHLAIPDPPEAAPGIPDEVLRVAIDQLGAGPRELLALGTGKPRSYQELALLNGITVPAVKSRLFRARQQLRRILVRAESDP
jgi:RNA polymerase sigma-70 factor, ECF subfamily